MIYSSCFCRSVYLLCTYRNDSNNHPGHLLNLSIFYLALIRFHIKFGEDRKDNLKKYFITIALPLSFSSDTHIDAISGISIKKFILLQYCFSKKYYNIRISTLLNFVRFTWALNREENLKVAGHLFESLWY